MIVEHESSKYKKISVLFISEIEKLAIKKKELEVKFVSFFYNFSSKHLSLPRKVRGARRRACVGLQVKPVVKKTSDLNVNLNSLTWFSAIVVLLFPPPPPLPPPPLPSPSPPLPPPPLPSPLRRNSFVHSGFQSNISQFPKFSEHCLPVFILITFNIFSPSFAQSSSFPRCFFCSRCNLFWNSLVLQSFNMNTPS